MNGSEVTEDIKTFPLYLTCCKGSRPCPTVSQYHLDDLVAQDTRHLCLTQPPPCELYAWQAIHVKCQALSEKHV